MQALAGIVRRHKDETAAVAQLRAQNLSLRSATTPLKHTSSDTLGSRMQDDKFLGDSRLRTLKVLLKRVDDNGFERSRHQVRQSPNSNYDIFDFLFYLPKVQFHDAFFRACARVLYKEAFAIKKKEILDLNGWSSAPSEVLISTPRRFGKTFSISMFVACISLSMSVDIVIFSPARRASRCVHLLKYDTYKILTWRSVSGSCWRRLFNLWKLRNAQTELSSTMLNV